MRPTEICGGGGGGLAHLATWGLKGGICHFTKWRIPPFSPQVTTSSRTAMADMMGDTGRIADCFAGFFRLWTIYHSIPLWEVGKKRDKNPDIWNVWVHGRLGRATWCQPGLGLLIMHSRLFGRHTRNYWWFRWIAHLQQRRSLYCSNHLKVIHLNY